MTTISLRFLGGSVEAPEPGSQVRPPEPLADVILMASASWAAPELTGLALLAATWAYARRIGQTPREVLAEQLERVVSDEEWRAKILPAFAEGEQRAVLSVLAEAGRN